MQPKKLFLLMILCMVTVSYSKDSNTIVLDPCDHVLPVSLNGNYDENALTMTSSEQAVLTFWDVGTRVLLVAQTAGMYQNGVYTLTDQGLISGYWMFTRSTDLDEESEWEYKYQFQVPIINDQENTMWYLQSPTSEYTNIMKSNGPDIVFARVANFVPPEVRSFFNFASNAIYNILVTTMPTDNPLLACSIYILDSGGVSFLLKDGQQDGQLVHLYGNSNTFVSGHFYQDFEDYSGIGFNYPAFLTFISISSKWQLYNYGEVEFLFIK